MGPRQCIQTIASGGFRGIDHSFASAAPPSVLIATPLLIATQRRGRLAPVGNLGFVSIDGDPALLAALLSGVGASLFCLLSQGGVMVLALGRPQRSSGALVFFHGGRLVALTSLGACAALLAPWAASGVSPLVVVAPAALVVVLGLAVLGAGRRPRCCAPGPLSAAEGFAPAAVCLVRGFLWGLLPCPATLGMLLLAATQSTQAAGAMVMLGFAVGSSLALVPASMLLRRVGPVGPFGLWARPVLAGLCLIPAAVPWLC